jgi:hypothetical protein
MRRRCVQYNILIRCGLSSKESEARGGAAGRGYKLYNDNPSSVPPVLSSGGIGVFLLSIVFTLARLRYSPFLRGGGSTVIYVPFLCQRYSISA